MPAHLMRRAVLVVAVAAFLVSAASAPARADTVTDWNAHATAALATAGQTPFISLAMVHGAVYDAVNAIDRRYEPYLGAPRARWWYSKEAAAATAAYHVLAELLPAQQPALAAHYATSLAGVRAGRAREGGIAVGHAAAEAMLAARADDGRFGAPGFPVGTAPGQWRPTPPAFVNDPNAWLARVTPFLIRSPSQFRSRGPNPLRSAAYAREFNEVKSVGSLESPDRSDDQTDAAKFWAGGFAPWITILRQLSVDRLRIADNARLYAMFYLTGADAVIAVWDDKARWRFWRPITAVHEAGTDGNRATRPDDEWAPLIVTPPYPDHPSGLSGISATFAGTLRDFFGTDTIALSVTSANSGTTRSYAGFSDAAEEVVDARVWSGIHFRIADEHGARIGKQVARYRAKHYFHRR